MKQVKILPQIMRKSLNAVDAKKEMVEATVTRDAVIELQTQFNALIDFMNAPRPEVKALLKSEKTTAAKTA